MRHAMAFNTIEGRIEQIPKEHVLTVLFALGLPLFMAEAYIVGDVYISAVLGIMWAVMGAHAIAEEVKA